MSTKSKLPTQRQLLAMAWLAFISPATRLMPQRTSAFAGSAAWLAPVAALAPVLFLMWVIRKMAPGGRLDDAMLSAFGPVAGKAVLLVYALWAVFMASMCLRFYGERFLTTAYPDARIEVFLIAMAVLVFLVLKKNFLSFARACEIYFIIIVLMLAVLLAFALRGVKVQELFPVSVLDAWPVMKAVYPICSVSSTLFFASFLPHQKTNGKSWYGFAAAALGTFALMNAIIIGTFSAPFVEKLQVPFFTMVKNIKMLRVFERVDALVLAYFVLTDLAYVGLMLFSAISLIKKVFALEHTAFLAAPLVVLIFLLSLLPRDGFAAEKITEKFIHPVNIFLGFAVILAAAVVLKKREGGLRPQDIESKTDEIPQDVDSEKKV